MSEEKSKDLTLQDLIDEKNKDNIITLEKKTNNNERFKTVSVEDIAGPTTTKTLQQVANDEFMNELDIAINRVKTEQFAPIIEEGKAIIMDKILEHEEEMAEASAAVKSKSEPDELDDVEETVVNIPTSREIVEDDDINDLEEDEEVSQQLNGMTDEKREQIINEFKQQIKAVIKPSKERPDLSKFSIRSKGMSISKVLSTKVPTKHVSNWVLPNSKRSISVSELSGTEIEKLNTNTGQLNRINSVKSMYNTIYEHIIDSNKPSTLEEWVKSISWFDTTHLYFAIYKACFENSNYVPHVCSNPNCNHTFIVKHAIEDMIKYKDEEAKAKIRKIFEKDTTAPTMQESNLVVISNDYAVALRPPSIYNVAFENAVLDEAFRNKYDESLSIISFIESIYLIDYESNDLIPIDIKTDPDDIIKTIKYKIRSFHRILSKLSSDEFIELRDTVNKMMLDEDTSCTYVYPEVECPKCKSKIEEQELDPLGMVFTRHRLTTIANS